MVAATLRSIFIQPDLAAAKDTTEQICRLFEKRYPTLVEVLREVETDVLAYCGFPVEHRCQIWPTNSLERLNKDVSRRCDVVGIFPSRNSLLRLAGTIRTDGATVAAELLLTRKAPASATSKRPAYSGSFCGGSPSYSPAKHQHRIPSSFCYEFLADTPSVG
jgi:transposase-like protein